MQSNQSLNCTQHQPDMPSIYIMRQKTSLLLTHHTDGSLDFQQYHLDASLRITGSDSERLVESADQLSHTDQHANIISLGRDVNNFVIGDNIQLYDQSVSRRHCTISYERDEMKPKLCRSFCGFMSCCSTSLPQFGEKVRLPRTIGMTILEYIRKPHGYFLRDVGSKFGTRVRLLKPAKIASKFEEVRDKFIIGQDISLSEFNVLKPSLDPLQLPHSVEEWHSQFQGTVLHQKALEDTASILVFAIKVSGHNTKHYMIYDSEHQVTIGFNADIRITESAFIDYDKPQCSVYYQNEHWWICEGTGTQRSVFGVHKVISTSLSYKLQPHNEIKLGMRTNITIDILHH